MKTRGKVIISIILIFGLILGGGAWWVKKNLFDEPFVTHVDPTTGKTIKAFNVLLLGSDARPNEKKEEQMPLLSSRYPRIESPCCRSPEIQGWIYQDTANKKLMPRLILKNLKSQQKLYQKLSDNLYINISWCVGRVL